MKEIDDARINVNTKTPGALDVELFKQKLALASKPIDQKTKGKNKGDKGAV